jgi:hypothetical protein
LASGSVAIIAVKPMPATRAAAINARFMGGTHATEGANVKSVILSVLCKNLLRVAVRCDDSMGALLMKQPEPLTVLTFR